MLNSSCHSHCLSTFPDANLMLAVPCKYRSSERNIKMKARFQFCIAESRRYSAKPSIFAAMPTEIIRQPSTIFLTLRKWGIPDDFLAIPCIEALPSLNSKGIVKSPQ